MRLGQKFISVFEHKLALTLLQSAFYSPQSFITLSLSLRPSHGLKIRSSQIFSISLIQKHETLTSRIFKIFLTINFHSTSTRTKNYFYFKFFQAASPACTELETIVLDWFAKAINLPSEFIFSAPGSVGGGVLQSSASECILVCMLAARTQAIKHFKKINGTPDEEDSVFLPKLVAYCSKESHSCVEKAAMIALVKLRILEADDKCSLRGQKLLEVRGKTEIVFS